MPTNRHAVIRYRVIDSCLRQVHRAWTAASLAEACADALTELGEDASPPSRSTISRDIKTMRRAHPLGYNAPIEWDARRNTYVYGDPDFSISNSPLREDDLQALDGVLSILRQFQYFRQVSELEALASRLQQNLWRSRRQGPPILLFSQSKGSPAHQWLDGLYQAAEKGYCLSLSYQPFVEEGFEAIVSPYLLKEYNRRWFLIGYRHDLQQLRTFALDRIQGAERYFLETFYRMPGFHPETYFKNIIGVSIMEDAPIEEIRFRTPLLRAKYLRTKPIHSSLKVVQENSDFVEFSLHLIPNYELESWLLSFGEEIQLLQPNWLAKKITSRLQQARDQYPDKL